MAKNNLSIFFLAEKRCFCRKKILDGLTKRHNLRLFVLLKQLPNRYCFCNLLVQRENEMARRCNRAAYAIAFLFPLIDDSVVGVEVRKNSGVAANGVGQNQAVVKTALNAVVSKRYDNRAVFVDGSEFLVLGYNSQMLVKRISVVVRKIYSDIAECIGISPFLILAYGCQHFI